MAASDPEGHRWKAAQGKRYSRFLTHLFVLSMVAPGISMTVASAHQAPPTRQRLLADAAALVALDQPGLGAQFQAPDLPALIAAAPPARLLVRTPPAPPKPKPVAIPYDKQAVANLIRAAAAKYGVNPDWLLRVAMCESHLNWNSYNDRSGATGLFQFKPATFYAHGGHNIWDAADQADVAARMFSQGLASEWACK